MESKAKDTYRRKFIQQTVMVSAGIALNGPVQL
jgi:hypothetical protein